MQFKCTVLLFMIYALFPARVKAQQEIAGNWPESSYRKFPYELNMMGVTLLASGDYGWFDDYMHAFMIDHNNRMWLAGRYGLAYSDDDGLKWKKCITQHSVCDIFETRKHTLLASSDNSYAMRSEDNGNKWSHQNVFGKGELKARSSHGERYTDIFYVQLDSTRILRTCQASDQLLLSDDEGKTWKVVKAPDHAISIFNIRDSIAVMFTYDQMYISSDRGATWKREKKGLPKPQDEMYGVISTGVVTEDGTIMALVSAQEDEVYQHLAYFYDLKKGKWEKDQTGRVYEWSSDEFFPAGGNAILLRNGETDKYSISYDKGKTWGVLNPNDPVGHPQDLFIQDNRIYIVAGNLYFFQFPPACTERNPEPPVVKGPHVSLNDSLKGKLLLFPVKMALASDQVSVYQQCAGKDGGCSKFIMHVPNDTVITVINILHLEGDVQVIEETYDVYATLQAGNYELWLYNISLTGCYFLQCRFKNETAGQRIGTSCYFY